MNSYKVVVRHFDLFTENGEQIEETRTIAEHTFRQKKEAKAFIEKELEGKKFAYRRYNNLAGSKSFCGYQGDNEWKHPVTGEIHREEFKFVLYKDN